jgi:hypothetical protein
MQDFQLTPQTARLSRTLGVANGSVYSDRTKRSPLKNVHGHRANFSITALFLGSRYGQRQRFPDARVNAQEGTAVAVTLQIATFVRGWANMSLEYKSMQRRVEVYKKDSRSSGG